MTIFRYSIVKCDIVKYMPKLIFQFQFKISISISISKFQLPDPILN